jgi:two-component system sensor histidine kinase DevS
MSEPEVTVPRTELDAAQRRITELTEELDATNRGIIALHTELDAAREAEARARADQEVLAERDRIARDLQDQVIHRVFDAGLKLQGVLGLLQPAAAIRVRAVITQLDATVRDLRTAIFGLHDQPQQATSLRALFADLISEHETDLGFTPTIDFQGPIDAAVPDHIATDLLTTTRAALTTLAGATGAEITLHATTEELVLRVDHDGPATTSVPHTLRERAHSHGGTLDLTTRPGTGIRLEWRVPLPLRIEPE